MTWGTGLKVTPSVGDVIKMMNPLLKKVIIANKNKKIFDIGCGCGRNLMFAIDYSSKLLGLDFSQRSLAIARTEGVFPAPPTVKLPAIPIPPSS